MRRCIEPAELCDGDLRCLGIETLRIDDGLDEWSPLSELGVWLPNDLRVGIWGDSSTIICTDAPDDRRELTELDRREDTEGRVQCAFVPLADPNFPFDAPLPRRPDEECVREAFIIFAGFPAPALDSLRLLFLSSLNQCLNCAIKLGRFRGMGSVALTLLRPLAAGESSEKLGVL